MLLNRIHWVCQESPLHKKWNIKATEFKWKVFLCIAIKLSVALFQPINLGNVPLHLIGVYILQPLVHGNHVPT